jgi:hypothetical protein
VRARDAGMNLRQACEQSIAISLDETTTREDIAALWRVFAKEGQALPTFEAFEKGIEPLIPESLRRTSAFLTHPVFNRFHSETGMLRYIRELSDMYGLKAPLKFQSETTVKIDAKSMTDEQIDRYIQRLSSGNG